MDWLAETGSFRDILDLAVAFALAVPIGWDRERETHRAGIRTFPIVAVAACAVTMIGVQMKGSSPDAYSRIIQGLVTGIGFIGGGAILKDRGTVSGTATAASIWSMGMIGAAIALHEYHIAVAVTVLTFLALKLLAPVRDELRRDPPSGDERSTPG